jgi:hypothetical protein
MVGSCSVRTAMVEEPRQARRAVMVAWVQARRPDYSIDAAHGWGVSRVCSSSVVKHEVRTVVEMNWPAQLENGDLLEAAEAAFDVMVPSDQTSGFSKI